MGCVSEKNGNSQQRLAWTFWSFASLFTSCQRWRKKASELLIILFSSISLCSVGKCLQKQQPSASLNGRKCGEVHRIFYSYLPGGLCQLVWGTLGPHCPPPLIQYNAALYLQGDHNNSCAQNSGSKTIHVDWKETCLHQSHCKWLLVILCLLPTEMKRSNSENTHVF